MQNLNKKLLIGLICVNLYSIVIDVLKALNVISFTDHDAKTFNILISMGAVIVLCLLIKDKDWILACVYWGLHVITRIFSAYLFMNYRTIYNIPIISVIISGIIFSVISSLYFIKLLRVRDFDFDEKFRLNDLGDYLKKKFRRNK